MSMFLFIIFFFILFAIEIIYFKIADNYNIIDHPNHRSSHSKITIRGGGIIFSVAFLLGSFYFEWEYAFFVAGLLLISFISFIDDIKPASRLMRILFHLIAVGLLFYQLKMYDLPLYCILAGFILVIGTINAVNFMDGINGITGGYGLITLVTLYCINKYGTIFIDGNYLIIGITALLVFNFFNFRKKAKCFAGDVGSISLAFIVVFFILQLIIKTNNLNYLLLLLVYGLDTATTILFRLFRKENILEAHRSHFYQYLANEKKMPHLLVAGLYMGAQLIINIILINSSPTSITHLILVVIITTTIFVFIRLITEGKRRLFESKV